MKLTAILPMLFFYPFFVAPSSRIVADSNNNNDAQCYYHWQTYNLIENIIKWHNFNAKFWLVVVEGIRNLSDSTVKCAFLRISNHSPKILALPIVNFPQTRNFAAIFLTSNDNIENQLNMSLMLPPDVIKIYLDHNGCQLNETKLAKIMDTLWLSREIGFIYYISFCSLSTTSNYDSIDSLRLSHKDNNCTISLFYHQPFVKNKSGQWGVMEKVSLINDRGGVKRQTINMNSQVFHRFPFQRKHNLNLNGLDMTVILFPSTGAYHKSELEIFRNQLSKEVLEDPFHNLDAYFGYDADVLRELKMQMNFTLHLSPTSDRQSYGFKVSVNT